MGAAGLVEARCSGSSELLATNWGSTEAARPGTCDGSNTYSGAYRRSSGVDTVYIKYSGYTNNFNTPTTTSSSYTNASLISDTNSSGFVYNCIIAPPNNPCAASVANSGF